MTSIEVEAPSRLHFGLYSFGGSGRSYGGVGAMIARPGLRLRLCEASGDDEFTGPHAERARRFVARWHKYHARPPTPLVLRIQQAPAEHAGLGLGTALGMSVAAALRAFYRMPPADASALAASVDRGKRSAVGAHGFLLGGLIAEAGRESNDELSALQEHVHPPAAWTFLLARPKTAPGLSGERESRAFADLPAVPVERREQLIQIALSELLPAAERGDFEAFADALHRYGRQAGECFAPLQGGPYNGPHVTALIHWAQRQGYPGAGQSSWGPTVFIPAASPADAERIGDRLQRQHPEVETEIAPLATTGARVTIDSEDSDAG